MSEVLIIIPAYNEAANIVNVINSIKDYYPEYDIVVINDGSEDNTGPLAESTNKAYVVHLPYNIGIGGSVQTGFKFAKKHDYKIACQFDGDGQHMIQEIQKIIEPIEKMEADCVIGSRFAQKQDCYKPNTLRMLGIFILRFFSFLIVHQRISDQTSGFRAYNKKSIAFLAKHYPKDYPEPEIIILLGRNGFTIKEVFTEMRERQGGISSIPFYRGPYYIIKVLLAMAMAALRSKKMN